MRKHVPSATLIRISRFEAGVGSKSRGLPLFNYDQEDSAQNGDGRKHVTHSNRFAEQKNSPGSGEDRHTKLHRGGTRRFQARQCTVPNDVTKSGSDRSGNYGVEDTGVIESRSREQNNTDHSSEWHGAQKVASGGGESVAASFAACRINAPTHARGTHYDRNNKRVR